MCLASCSSAFEVLGEAIKMETKYQTEQRLRMRGRKKKPHVFYSEVNVLTLCVERDPKNIFPTSCWIQDQYKLAFFSSQRMSIITCSLTQLLARWQTLGQYPQGAFICSHFHLTRMKILGASDFMLAITIIIMAFYSLLQRDILWLCKIVPPPPLGLELPWWKLTLSL